MTDSKVFERYGIESVVSRIDDLYEQALAARPPRMRRRAARRAAARRPSPAPPRAAGPPAAESGVAVGQTTEGTG